MEAKKLRKRYPDTGSYNIDLDYLDAENEMNSYVEDLYNECNNEHSGVAAEATRQEIRIKTTKC